ncbi:hypothetical protein ABG864_12470 [Phocaeicola vulgatus]|nr:hypothetical protein [Phocaeicola vulgatus]MDB1003149.1 hypothetical protein [Phocaeicola vulgatus]MDC1604728.1 hypothetical protein [Phocaeicola vulgatus]MDC1609130.1 hypothetical protein [Phocaeicola vulgatus]MDC1615664.1 hypothetical protein [Phocaeicola vulgatus]
MGIGKGKSNKIDINSLIGSVNNENKATQEASSLTEEVAELEQATKALNTAIDRANSIITAFNKSVNELQSRKIGAQVHPQTLKSLNDICTNFVVEVSRQLMVHRDKQLELQKEHEERIACMLKNNEGIWLSNRWVIFTVIVLGIFCLAVILWAVCK